MIVSPSQDSFYNGFPGYSQVEDSTFTALPTGALQDPTPVVWPPGTFQGFSSRVTTSKLITEEEEKGEIEGEEGGRIDSPELYHSRPQSSKQGLKFSDPNIGTITELDVETESPEEHRFGPNEGSSDAGLGPSSRRDTAGADPRGDTLGGTWNGTAEASEGSGNSTAEGCTGNTPRGDTVGSTWNSTAEALPRSEWSGGSGNSTAEGRRGNTAEGPRGALGGTWNGTTEALPRSDPMVGGNNAAEGRRGNTARDALYGTTEALPRSDPMAGSGNSTAGNPQDDTAGGSRNGAAVRPGDSTAEGPAGGLSSDNVGDTSDSSNMAESPRDSTAGGPSVGVPESREARRLLMQASIERGMQGIMAKVVSETKQNSPSTRKPYSRSHTAPSSIHIPMEEHRAQAARKVQIRPLICSPTDLKRYPNFVFTPAPSKGNVSDRETRGRSRHSPNRFECHEQKENYGRGCEEEDDWFGEDMNDGDGWLGSGGGSVVKERVSDSGGRGEGEENWLGRGKGVQGRRSLLDKADAIVGPLPLEDNNDTVGGTARGSSPRPTISSHKSSEGVVRTRKSLFHTIDIKREDPVIPEVVIMQSSPSRFFEAPSRRHYHSTKSLVSAPTNDQYHSTKSLVSAPTSNSQYKTEMELVKPLSAFLNRKFSSNRPLKSSMNHSVSTNDLSAEKSASIFSSDIKIEKAGTDAVSNLSMRRSRTDVPVGRTSVTKLKRPHSFHVSKRLPKDSGAVDFTKDEFIRRAALQGMMRKPRSRRPSQDGPTSPHRVSKDKEVVSDLDALLLQRKASNESTAPNSPTEGKGSTANVDTGQRYFTKYVSEKRRSTSGGSISSADSRNADLSAKKRHSYGETHSKTNTTGSSSSNKTGIVAKHASDGSRSAVELNGVCEKTRGVRRVGGAEGREEERGEKLEGVTEKRNREWKRGRDGVKAVTERRCKVVVEVVEERSGERAEEQVEKMASRMGEEEGYEEGERKGNTEANERIGEERRAENSCGKNRVGMEWTGEVLVEEEKTESKVGNTEKEGDRKESITNTAGKDSGEGESAGKERLNREREEGVKETALQDEQESARVTAWKDGECTEMGGQNEVREESTAWKDGEGAEVEGQNGAREENTAWKDGEGAEVEGKNGAREENTAWKDGEDAEVRGQNGVREEGIKGTVWEEEGESAGMEGQNEMRDEGINGEDEGEEGQNREREESSALVKGENGGREERFESAAQKEREDEEWSVRIKGNRKTGDWMGDKILRPQSAPVTPGNYQEAAYIIQHEPEKLCWTQF